MATQELQQQLNQANHQIQEQQTQLTNSATSKDQLNRHPHDAAADNHKPKKNEPEKFSEKGSMASWTTHMDNYLGDSDKNDALPFVQQSQAVDESH